MKEGFEQPSDAAFANMVFTAKGSVIELGEPIGRMMGFIKYLAATGFTDRGRHSIAPKPPKPTNPQCIPDP